MPAPGDQHNTIINPFEDVKPRVSEFTAQEIATLQSRLEKQLGPEYLSARTGPSGQKVHYIAAEKCIALANEVFGFNGWSSSIMNLQVDFVDENPQTMKISLGLSVVVRVTLRDGTYHEDIGYGHIENCKGKAAAFEKAKKEGTTDALKRALRSFGNVLGNCIYDKAYLQKVTKMKVEPSKFNEGELHRHSDYVKKEPDEIKPDVSTSTATISATDSFEDLLGEFDDEVDFCVTEEDHPDEVSLPSNDRPQGPPKNGNPVNAPPMQPPSRPLGRSSSAGNAPRPPQTPNQPPGRAYPAGGHQSHPNNQGFRPQPQQQNQSRPQSHQTGHNAAQHFGHPGVAQQTPPGPQNRAQNGGSGSEGPGFFSARAVNALVGPKEDIEPRLPEAPQLGQVFNPRAESPSIRKTPGIDHTTSKPLGRNGQHVAPTEHGDQETTGPPPGNKPITAGSVAGKPTGQSAPRGNVPNPQLDQVRRIGAPGGPGSPLANRGQYRPPTMKRPLPTEAGGTVMSPSRPALTEVTTNGTVNGVATAAGVDVKRQKTS